MGLVAGALFPHPPIIVPDVSPRHLDAVATTRAAAAWAAAFISSVRPDSLILITPHGPAYRDHVPVVVADRLSGDLSGFDSHYLCDLPGDRQLSERIISLARAGGLPVVDEEPDQLDHGSLVPLYYLEQAGLTVPTALVGIGLIDRGDLLRLGEACAEAAVELGRRTAIVASGDLSHRLKPGAPAGFDPKGAEFDQAVVDVVLTGDRGRLLGLGEELVAGAGECGLRPLAVLMGAMPGPLDVLSYEGPFGVGYLVALARSEPLPVRVARNALRELFGIAVAAETAAEGLGERAGAFVSLKRDGQLRGCIGTIEPTRPTVYEEIRDMAVSSAVHDPRFEAVTREELPYLELSVDILGAPEQVSGVDQLSPRTHGVIVTEGRRRGVLLPDLEGIDDPDDQYQIACRKAGIDPGSSRVRLHRFTVNRHR